MEFVSQDVSWKPQVIMPIGDIQWFGEEAEVAIDKLKRYIEWGMERNAWFIGLGDYIDAFSPSNRRKMIEAGFYDNTLKVVDKAGRHLVQELYTKALKPSKGRWLGLLAGHHYAMLRDGTTTDQYLAGMLNSTFLGDCAYIRLVFHRAGAAGEVLIWAHHGVGSGVSAAAPITKLERLPNTWAGDIFLMGHQHKIVATPVDRVEPVWPKTGTAGPALVARTVLLVGTGSFLKGYIPNRMDGLQPAGSYVEKAMLRPVSLGAPVITITPRKRDMRSQGGGEYWNPDLRVSL